MLQVKLFDEEHEEDLETEMNEFLAALPEGSIKEIQYQVAISDNGEEEEDAIFSYSAMIIYRKT
ncbi:sporulation protein Cse60 [Fictibacillus aquaticus]|uniref:Sporulation protein cse60 n=1 Tax=Fictibacillus aquaticus TaxID=2021314 RepID=A0A235FAA7_9BACL|nr:sporulation protein Cse60 [Fictibacillus aquaticus]OYD58270.1 sporulation protein cse60 [Fictibacillus aquaticus]